MALTQVSTGGIKDGQISTADLADAQITASKLHGDALDHTYTLGASGTDHYTFTGEGLTGAVNDATLYLTRGKTYRFVNGNSSGAHPFRIQSVAGAGGTEYNTGVTNNAGAGGSTIIFEVPHDAPDVLYYICTSHATMNGIFYVTGALADGTVTTAKLAADAVTSAKIADDAVTGDHVAADAISTSHIADNSILAAQIANEAVTLAKLPHGDGSSDGKFLRANNGADPTFETVSGTTINNNANNRIITGSGTANTLEGEASFTFDSGVADITGKLRIDVDSTSGPGSGNVEGIFLRNTNETDDNAVTIFGGADDYAAAASAINFINVDHSANEGAISFDTRASGNSYAERMRIESTGKVMMGSSTQTANGSADNLVIYDANAAGITIATGTTNQDCSIYFADSDDNDNGKLVYMTGNRQFRFYLDGSGSPVMQWNPDNSIYFNGNMYSGGGQYSTGSDINMKSNLVRFTGTLDKLKEIVGYKFDVTVPATGAKISSAGVIAQDVEKVYPELVEEVEGYKHLQYNALIGVLVEAVKELTTKVETLETKVAALEAA